MMRKRRIHEHGDSIVEIRRKIQKSGTERAPLLDDTNMRHDESLTRTLVCPGETECVVVDDMTTPGKCFDTIFWCTGKEVMPPIIYIPDER